MSKLDEIYNEVGESYYWEGVVDEEDVEFRRDKFRGKVRILMLDLLIESLKESDGDVGKLADKFTEKVKGL